MSSDFAPLPFEPGYRRVAAAIASRIHNRSLREGDSLPSETELATQFVVNRSTIREALRELESADLVTRRRGTKRLVVNHPATLQIASRISDALALNDITVREVCEMLESIEPPAAEAAALRASPETLSRIQSAVIAYEQASTAAPEAIAGVMEFFRAITAATGNRIQPIIQEPMFMLLAAALILMIDRAPAARHRIGTAQKAILAAIEQRDGATARLGMGKHVRDVRRGFDVTGIDLATPLPAPFIDRDP